MLERWPTFALLLALPVLGAVAELLDVAASRVMKPHAIMFAYRSMALSMMSLVYFYGYSKNERPPLSSVGVLLMAASAALVIVLGSIYFEALRRSSPTVVAVAGACAPVVVLMLSLVLFGERLSLLRGAWAIATVVCLLGVV